MKPTALPIFALSLLVLVGCKRVPKEDGESQIAETEEQERSQPAVEAKGMDLGPKPLDSTQEPKVKKIPGKSVLANASLEAARTTFSQLVEQSSEKGLKVSLYAVFERAYSGPVSLRALDEQGRELGRSLKDVPLRQKEDTATYLSFQFDPRMPLDEVASYRVFGPAQAQEEPPVPSLGSRSIGHSKSTSLTPKNP